MADYCFAGREIDDECCVCRTGSYLGFRSRTGVQIHWCPDHILIKEYRIESINTLGIAL